MSGTRQFVVAFSTTGPSPKDGHRFSEVLLVGQDGGELNDQSARFTFALRSESETLLTFATALTTIKALVGSSMIVVHDAGKWRRFLRAELKTVKRHGAGHLLTNVLDVGAWAHQRFPRQRKDVAAIARRVGVEVPSGLTGLELEVELLRCIANVMAISTASFTIPEAKLSAAGRLNDRLPGRRPWVERIGNFWRALTGRA